MCQQDHTGSVWFVTTHVSAGHTGSVWFATTHVSAGHTGSVWFVTTHVAAGPDRKCLVCSYTCVSRTNRKCLVCNYTCCSKTTQEAQCMGETFLPHGGNSQFENCPNKEILILKLCPPNRPPLPPQMLASWMPEEPLNVGLMDARRAPKCWPHGCQESP